MEYFYLKAKKDIEGHVHRIGIFGIEIRPRVWSGGPPVHVAGVVCGLSDSFSREEALRIFKCRMSGREEKDIFPNDEMEKKSVVRKYFRCQRAMINVILFKDFMKKFRIYQPAKARNIDWEYCEHVWSRIKNSAIEGHVWKKWSE